MKRTKAVKLRGSGAPARKHRGRPLLLVLSAALATAGIAATTGYQYDALGRLIEVTHNNGNVTTYSLDAAGNRTQVHDLSTVTPPASITVPASSTGSYTVSWTPGGSVSGYDLYESTNSSFTTQTRVYQGASTSTAISGHTSGTYYYRVQGCAGSACTAYRTASNGVTVSSAPPGPSQPTGLQSNQNSGCSWYASWNASSGATSYQIRDKSGNYQYTVSGTNTSYSFCYAPGYTGNPNDYKPKWVKACNGSTCSLQSNFP